MESIKEKFAKYLEDNGLSLSRAEREAGLSNGLLGKLFKTEKQFTKETLDSILRAYPDFNENKGKKVTKTDSNPLIDQAKQLAKGVGQIKPEFMNEIITALLEANKISQGHLGTAQAQVNAIIEISKEQMSIIKGLTVGDKKGVEKKDRDDVLGKTG